jgi:hypothetical protein
MRSLLRIATLVIAGLSPVACNALVGEYEADLIPSVSSQHLCDIERNVFTFDLDLSSNEQLEDLTAYYDAANPNLVQHLSTMATAYRDGEPGLGVTYIMGTAGVGKSFAARNIFDGFLDTEQCTVKLSDLFYDEKDKLGFEVVQKPDLETTDGQVVFNELPSMQDVSGFELDSLFTASGCNEGGTLPPLVIIDDLDEVHDEICLAILREVDEYIFDGAPGAGTFLHIVVVGRPEGFYTWRTDPARTEKSNEIVDAFTLEAPRYRTAGDLEFRVRGYLDFIDELDSIEAAGQLGAYIDSVTQAVDTYPFLTYSLGNLSVGNVVIAHTVPGLDETEPELKAGMFDDILDRATKTHGRPAPGTELGGPYLRLLEEIAVRYRDVNEQGEFSVRSEDTLEAFDIDGSSLGYVRVQDVLNRAGVALPVSATGLALRYRFDPFWLHAHLIERYNQRTNPAYSYQTCE